MSSSLMATYPEAPVTFVRGSGSWLVDTDGYHYLDFLSGLAVTSLGHAHPVVANVLAKQARTLCHVSNLFGNVVGPQVARMLDRLVGGGTEPAGGQVFLTNSGAEANECAIKLARKWAGPRRHVVVSAYGSFHGRTLATLAATGQPEKHEPFEPMPEGFRHVAWNDMEALDTAVDPTVVAAVMLEPIQGEGGINELAPGYLPALRRLCDERGVLLVMDEIQTGLGRTGKWFGFQHFDIHPDIVTVAKALGNGAPIGACWAKGDVAGVFQPGDHGSTFGGQPLAASAAKATLSVMESEDVRTRAAKKGSRLRAALEATPGVDSVRGKGLLLGVELAGAGAKEVTAGALASGLIVNAVGPTTVRLAPSLLVTDEEIDQGVQLLAAAIATREAEVPR